MFSVEEKKFYLIIWKKKSIVVSAETSFEAINSWLDHEDEKRRRRKLKTPFSPGDYGVQEIEGLYIAHEKK